MSEDKRKYPRLPLDVQVNYNENAFARSEDFSEGGICLIIGRSLEEGKILTLSFYLPQSEERLEVYGKVCWSKPETKTLHKNGIEFWNIDDDIKQKLKDYFESH